MAFSLSHPAPAFADPEGIFNFDDCGALGLTNDGCLVFYPDNHPGHYYLQYYGYFTAGARVHVSGEHSPYFHCPCGSRCIQSNSISEGCSVPCSEVPGDASNDARVNIADISLVVRYIFSKNTSLICSEQADCNGNGRVEIGDASCLIEIIF
ncbi:MAG TPA: dockerin type I repeat-containing protein [candidate division Zixibacteria bacterium]|nr:dockerin type I repeat-containing protein [candidate division Zixibacteria bacterium]